MKMHHGDLMRITEVTPGWPQIKEWPINEPWSGLELTNYRVDTSLYTHMKSVKFFADYPATKTLNTVPAFVLYIDESIPTTTAEQMATSYMLALNAVRMNPEPMTLEKYNALQRQRH